MTEPATGCPKYDDPNVTCYCNDCLDRACDENGVPRVTGKAWERIRRPYPSPAEGAP